MTPGNRGLTGTHSRVIYGPITKPRAMRGFCVSGAYDWRKDAIDSFHLALHLKALALGHKRPATPAECYWVEQHGSIP